MSANSNQEAYRAANHYRQALLRGGDGAELVWVDDLTFNPDVHEEIPAEEPGSDPA